MVIISNLWHGLLLTYSMYWFWIIHTHAHLCCTTKQTVKLKHLKEMKHCKTKEAGNGIFMQCLQLQFESHDKHIQFCPRSFVISPAKVCAHGFNKTIKVSQHSVTWAYAKVSMQTHKGFVEALEPANVGIPQTTHSHFHQGVSVSVHVCQQKNVLTLSETKPIDMVWTKHREPDQQTPTFN